MVLIMNPKELRKYIRSHYSVDRIKGKFTSFYGKQGVQEIKEFFILQTPVQFQNICFICTKKKVFIGYIYARQSSDFLVSLIKSILLDKITDNQSNSIDFPWKKENFHILQYRFPKDTQSLKLIVVSELREVTEISLLFSLFDELNTDFHKCISNLINKTKN